MKQASMSKWILTQQPVAGYRYSGQRFEAQSPTDCEATLVETANRLGAAINKSTYGPMNGHPIDSAIGSSARIGEARLDQEIARSAPLPPHGPPSTPIKNPDRIAVVDWVHAGLSNVAGSLLETGWYHIHRGVLNPLGPGPALLRIFDRCNEEMVRSDHVDAEYAAEQKRPLRQNVAEVG